MARTTFSGPVASENGFISVASTSGNTLTIEAPAALSADTTLTFPDGAGTAGQQLTTDGTGILTWSAASGSGDVVGPSSSTDNAITRYDSTTGKLLQNSLVTVSDAGAIVAPQAGSVIPFYFDDQAAFPSASTYHGAVAHSHADGAMYYAHGGAWNLLYSPSTLNLSSPPTIGNTAPNTGGFTTLAATSVGVTNTSATTALFEPVVVSSTLTGAGVTGGRAKFATTIDAAAGSFSNALKADVTYGASGSTTGLGSAFVAEMTLSAGTTAGTYAPIEIELNAATGDSTGTLTSLIHASVNGTGADSVVNANGVLVNLVGMTAGSAGDTDMVTAPGGNFVANDLLTGIGIKVKVGASFFYIPLVAAADYQDD
jgi:hypothetical protein